MDKESPNSVLTSIVIDDYIEYIQLSKHRRPVYYKKGDKIPKKYLNDKYEFNKGILVSSDTKEKIIKNSRSVGTPKRKKISGQDIWMGMHYALRSKIAKELKLYLKKQFKKLGLEPIKAEDYPISIQLDFYKPFGEANWDIDNHALIYRKCILDALKGDYIEDDSVKFVRGIPSFYIPCKKEDQKLVITIYKLPNIIPNDN